MSARSTPGESAVRIELGERSYDVVIGAGVLGTLADRMKGLGFAGRAFVVADDKLPDELVRGVKLQLEAGGFVVSSAGVHADEREKSMATVAGLLERVAESRLERADPIIALGGGLTGDVAGFVAASYRRGAPVIQCPTTLLAMVDASVGGKTGVNLETTTGLKKNMAGAFWQPRLVLADPRTLRSLDRRQLRAGLAECVKHGMIAGSAGVEIDLAESAPSLMKRILAGDEAAACELVERNVRVKAAIVRGDEREEALSSAGGRALLNLGHTFGHVIEPIGSLTIEGEDTGGLLHGEAVALGLVAASAAAIQSGHAERGLLNRTRADLRLAGLPTSVSGLPADDALIGAMSHDKKSAGGVLRVVLPTGGGKATVVVDPSQDLLRAGWAAIRA